MYLCLYHLLAFVTPWFPRSVYTIRCSMYSGILKCSHAWFTTALDWTARATGATRVCHEDYWWRQVQVNAQTHGINGFSLLRQWSCRCLPTFQRGWVNQKWPMSLLYCCFVTFISTKAPHWTYYSACVLFVNVEPYRPKGHSHEARCYALSMRIRSESNWMRIRCTSIAFTWHNR